MAIKSKNEMPGQDKIHIDLTGPEGNAFCLIGLARELYKQLYREEQKEVSEIIKAFVDLPKDQKVIKPIDALIEEMMSGDYEHLLKVFDREFGEFVVLYR